MPKSPTINQPQDPLPSDIVTKPPDPPTNISIPDGSPTNNNSIPDGPTNNSITDGSCISPPLVQFPLSYLTHTSPTGQVMSLLYCM